MSFRVVIVKTKILIGVGFIMLGVVLWSDTEDRKAVIWCEDHGDLAFFKEPEGGICGDVALDAGDLVQFELEFDKRLRRAINPRLVSEGVCPDIAGQLRFPAVTKVSKDAEQDRNSAEIIPFGPRLAATHMRQPTQIPSASGA